MFISACVEKFCVFRLFNFWHNNKNLAKAWCISATSKISTVTPVRVSMSANVSNILSMIVKFHNYKHIEVSKYNHDQMLIILLLSYKNYKNKVKRNKRVHCRKRHLDATGPCILNMKHYNQGIGCQPTLAKLYYES